jgi:ribosome biogenesis GTPase / thiamine phosphate phosphatase
VTKPIQNNAADGAPHPLELVELQALGWTEAHALGWRELHATGNGGPGSTFDTTRATAVPGRVIAQHRGRYRVAAAGGECDAVLPGRMRGLHAADLPEVGDWVVLHATAAAGMATVQSLLPRTGVLRRKRPGTTEPQVIAANVDSTLIAVSLAEPVNARRIERYAALARDAGTTAIVVLTKLDLCTDMAGALATAARACPGAELVALSAAERAGLDDLRALLPAGRTAVIVGPSGAGKSTLTNALLGEQRLVTRSVRRDGKGRHATTHRELFRLPHGALLIDTPGLREVGLWDAEDGVHAVFDDIESLTTGCRFTDCRHETEPGCAVRAAAADGSVAPDRLTAWRRLRRELEHDARSSDRIAAAEEKARMKARQRAYRAHVERKERH